MSTQQPGPGTSFHFPSTIEVGFSPKYTSSSFLTASPILVLAWVFIFQLLLLNSAKQHVHNKLWLLSGLIWLINGGVIFKFFPNLYSSGFKCKGLKFVSPSGCHLWTET